MLYISQVLGQPIVDARGEQIAMIKRGIEQQDTNGVPPLKVAEAVEHALVSPRPRDRYLVGNDAKVVGIMSRFAPDKVKDLIVRATSTK